MRALRPACAASRSRLSSRSSRAIASGVRDACEHTGMEVSGTIANSQNHGSSAVQPQTKLISGRFVPAQLPRPDSADFVKLLWQWERLGLPLVGIGRFAPQMPQLRPSHEDAPSFAQLDAESDDFIESGRWLRRDRWHPVRLPVMCMRASAARHLDLLSDHEIGDVVLALPGDPGSHRDHNRYRSVAATVRRGDQHWTALGAWPWCVFRGEPPGHWWEHNQARLALVVVVQALAADLEARARDVRSLASRLAGVPSERVKILAP